MPDLSIIIVSYKGYERLKQCLDSLISFSGRILSTEVIIVNNSPGDNAFRSFENLYPGFRFINNEINGGYAYGCNKGVRNASGQFILILNPDTIVTERSLEELIKTAKSNPEFVITSCRQVNEKGHVCIAWGSFPGFRNLTGLLRVIFRSGYQSQVRVKDLLHVNIFFPDWVSGSVILISKENYIRLNGFDEDFWMYFEDVDLCKRARDMGGEVAFCNDISIEHNHGGSSRINKSTASLTKAEVLISKHVYFSKHKSGFQKLMIQVFLIINNLISFGLVAAAGLLFFFIPKLFLRTLIYFKLIQYYAGALLKGSWVSPRSATHKKLTSLR
jgi:GT2 family glycosyltransferase